MPQQHQKTSPRVLSLALLALAAASSQASADMTSSIEDALKFGNGGAVKFDLNTRYENVNQDAGASNPKTAEGVTSRLRIGLLSPVFHGIQGFAEFEGNLAMLENFNSSRNNNTAYSKILDPEKSELNQLWLSYAGVPDTLIKGGRQRIKLDDDRFIGNVGWRQMETTFDSV